MSNKARGVFEIETKDLGTYKFKLTTNAICEIEEELGKPIQMLDENVGMRELRIIFWAGLHEYQDEITKKDAGNIIDDLGWKKATETFVEAVRTSFPESEAAKSGNNTGNNKEASKGKNSGQQ